MSSIDRSPPNRNMPAGRPLSRCQENTSAMLDVENLSVGFMSAGRLSPIVQNVSFSIHPGQSVALVGESGSGKTLTCRSILRILPKAARCGGSIRLDCGHGKTDLLSLSERDLRPVRGNQISMIFQEPMSALSPLHTIGDQVAEVLRLHDGQSERAARAACLRMFEHVGFPDPERAFRSRPFQLSGGLRQRAMIAMAMISRPRLLIADEPTTALDVTLQAQVLGLIKSLQEETGMAVLLVTHDLGVVANMADAVVVMHAGRVMEKGTVRDVLGAPGHPYTRRLMAAAPHAPGTPAPSMPPSPAPQPDGDIILDLRGLRKTYSVAARSVRAVAGVDLQLRRGETLAIVGESGSGKTTLARLAVTLERPDPGGAILFRDQPGAPAHDILAAGRAGLHAFRKQAQMVFQDPWASLSPRMTVGDILTEPLDIHRVGTRADRRDRAAALLQQVGLPPTALTRYPHAFSGGQRQRIGIARALALRPSLLVCDEPTSALDVSVQAQVLALLEQIKADLNLSLLFISHDLAVVSRLADSVAVMRAGHVVEQAPPEVLFTAPVHPYTRALVAASLTPDVHRTIDLRAVALGAGDPSGWPLSFRPDDTGDLPPLRPLSPGHLVRETAP